LAALPHTSCCPVLSRSKLLRGYISRLWNLRKSTPRMHGKCNICHKKYSKKKIFLNFRLTRRASQQGMTCPAGVQGQNQKLPSNAGTEDLCCVVGGCCSWQPYPQENTSWCFGPECGSATGIFATAGTLEQQGKQQQQQRQKEHLHGRQLH
jgi:hypothetical protein